MTASAPTSVVVRMYRELLGDCFLIRLSGESGETSHILIDCGLLQGVKGAKERLTAIAEDIEKTTRGKVDLLVVTHEHWDHMGGFSLAKDILLDPDRIAYDNVWMAWTENPADDQANELRQGLTDRKTALAQVSMALEGSDKLDKLTEDLSKFIGPVETSSSGLGIAPQGRLTGGRVMDEIKKAAKTQPPQFLEPGNVVDTPGKLSMPAAVLGPPRSLALLKKDLPSQGADRETYFGEQLLKFSLLGADSDVDEGTAGTGKVETKSPFRNDFCVRFDDKSKAEAKWATRKPGSTERWLFDHYFAAIDDSTRAQSYRRIDGEWTLAASSLALKLDSDTNNTSLVLAFRLPDDSFLLFAADAQVGNWLSWHDQTYRFGDQDLTAADILGRTRLYKVGHHGSHNATLRAKGLELMVRPDLVSMISTIEDVAKEQGTKGWEMPDPDVKKPLLERCGGRVIRGDRLWSADDDTASYRPQSDFGLDESSALYVELTVYERPKTSKAKEARNGQSVQPRQRQAARRKDPAPANLR